MFRNLDVAYVLDFQLVPQVLQHGPTPFGTGMRDVGCVIWSICAWDVLSIRSMLVDTVQVAYGLPTHSYPVCVHAVDSTSGGSLWLLSGTRGEFPRTPSPLESNR